LLEARFYSDYSVLVLVNKLFWLEHILVYLWRAEHIATASAVKSFLWQQHHALKKSACTYDCMLPSWSSLSQQQQTGSS